MQPSANNTVHKSKASSCNSLQLQSTKCCYYMWKELTHEKESYDVRFQNQVSSYLKIQRKFEPKVLSFYQLKNI